MRKNLPKICFFFYYFNNVVKYLNLKYNLEHLNDISDENDPIKIATKKVSKSS